jgi:hypothetical protein
MEEVALMELVEKWMCMLMEGKDSSMTSRFWQVVVPFIDIGQMAEEQVWIKKEVIQC